MLFVYVLPLLEYNWIEGRNSACMVHIGNPIFCVYHIPGT